MALAVLPSVASSCAATFRRSAAPSLVFCSLGSAGSIRANYAGLPARLRRTKCQFCMVRGGSHLLPVNRERVGIILCMLFQKATHRSKVFQLFIKYLQLEKCHFSRLRLTKTLLWPMTNDPLGGVVVPPRGGGIPVCYWAPHAQETKKRKQTQGLFPFFDRHSAVMRAPAVPAFS